MKICNDVRIIIAALLGYQHTLDIYMAPNETPESRDPISTREFKIAHPPVNTSMYILGAPTSRGGPATEYKNSLRIPYRDTFQYRGIKLYSS